jgi:hypothetical protein
MWHEPLAIASFTILGVGILVVLSAAALLLQRRQGRCIVEDSNRVMVTIVHRNDAITVDGDNDEELMCTVVDELTALRESSPEDHLSPAKAADDPSLTRGGLLFASQADRSAPAGPAREGRGMSQDVAGIANSPPWADLLLIAAPQEVPAPKKESTLFSPGAGTPIVARQGAGKSEGILGNEPIIEREPRGSGT